MLSEMLSAKPILVRETPSQGSSQKENDQGSSQEENDQFARSTKKYKRKITHLIFNRDSPQPQQPVHPINQSKQPNSMSYRDMVRQDQMQGNLLHQSDTLNDDDDDYSDDDEAPEGVIDDPRCPVILLTKEEKMRIRKPWKHTLIIKMFNRKIGYMALMKRLKKKWELKGGLILTDIGYDYFIARFSIVDDYNHVLTQGPWMLDDNYLTIRKWVPNFIPDDAPLRFLTAWVRIPNLSVEYFDKEFLLKVGNKIGKVVRIDNNTAMAQRSQFTRLSIELDLSKPLLSKFWLKGKVLRVQYEGLRLICFNCGKIGHQSDKCPAVCDKELNGEAEMDFNPTNIPLAPRIEEEYYGSWMIVKKPPPRKRNLRPEKTAGRAQATPAARQIKPRPS
ncbi:uncharacterized protein LOC110731183 [Chenopodium quinoa]|uniref:uncharacterized protein LOC110694052 n=1 Tax=Chenopodium quinoa TaxID=63459 RepID=UPI000B78A38E|nr:uncharacterized protein LOC110694052 [Chenopodium quinoa]XP_021766705.1 uncharacterized protein LOC110731183 [Chenopodium quinoa]